MFYSIFRAAMLTSILFASYACAGSDALQSPPRTPEVQKWETPYQQSQESNPHCHCTADSHCGCFDGKPCTCNAENSGYYDGCCGGGVSQTEGDPDFNCHMAPPITYHERGFDSIVAEECGVSGVWLPEDPILFRPLIADPRQICYSAGWRFNDQVLVKNVIDVSFGDSVGFYRWYNVWPWCGELQIDLEGALWAVFDPLHDSSPLMNADYYGGLVLTYAADIWEFRLRAYHISSHIGDEFLLDHPDFHRRNASSEYLDFFVSCDWTDEIRLFSGIGYTLGEDEEFKIGRWYSALGFEVRIRRLGFTDWCEQLYGEPFIATYFRSNKSFKHHVDQTYVVGYEWGKLSGLCRKLRVYLEYHDGYSLEGQFQKEPTNYLSVRASYGF